MKQNQALTSETFTRKKDKAYFAPKSELFAWISATLKLEIKSIEETQTGAIFCQLLDAAHPGTVRMNKVNWKAKLETEYISNFKLFQQGLSNNNIDKMINIQRLSKGKTQELIELLQWLYGHHLSLGVDPNSYDAVKKRNGNNFVYFGKNLNNINAFSRNNFGIRDDISKCSGNTDYKDFFGIKHNLKNKNNSNSNINSLNSNLRSNNFHTKFNNNNHYNNVNNKKNKDKNIRGKSQATSINNSNDSNSIISLNSSSHYQKINSSEKSHKNKNTNSNVKNDDLIHNQNLNNITPLIIEEKPEEEEKLNSILFDGISNIDKENILELEKNDGNNITNLKILIRKLRINNIIFKNNLGSILNQVTKERDFYLNKLKDIEYLYFNPIIRNNNENKNTLLKSILKSQVDSTVLINNEGIASIKSISNEHNGVIINPKNNSQSIMRIKLAYSKNNNKKEIDFNENNENGFKIYNKTQPIFSETNKKKFESNIFPLKNDFIFDNNNENNNHNSNNRRDKHVTPSTKTAYYDISSHILNESLHIPNTENSNPNLNNNDNNNNNDNSIDLD